MLPPFLRMVLLKFLGFLYKDKLDIDIINLSNMERLTDSLQIE
uniref:Uncharacterized protein n=1 Tax=uncultured Desulfobacterium sp. TaxID=201089 RepID=E1YAT6_9BACT|nr:unknown protein [uncultured Desulfobacterium sp.]